MNEEKLFIYAIALIAVVFVAWAALAWIETGKQVKAGELPSTGKFQPSQEKYEKFVKAELPDKCKAPPGTSQEDWEEHLSHHPERYSECLGGK